MKKVCISLGVVSACVVGLLSMTSIPRVHAEERLPEMDCESMTSDSDDSMGTGSSDDSMGTSSPSKTLCYMVVDLNRQVAVLRNLLVAQQESLNGLIEQVKALKANTGNTGNVGSCTGGDSAQRWSRNNHCYIGFNRTANFEGAANSCAEVGAHLVSITSNEENDYVVKTFAPRDAGGNGKEVWIGFTDRRFESENVKNISKWEWVTGEVQLSGDSIFHKFSAGEPNNGNNNANEDCAVIHGNRGGLWDDKECNSQRAFVCEKNQ